MTYLGPITAAPCPRCTRPLRLVDRVLVCPDQIHCQHHTKFAGPRRGRNYYVDHMRAGVAA